MNNEQVVENDSALQNFPKLRVDCRAVSLRSMGEDSMTREAEIETYLVKQVKALGGEVRKVKWIGRRGAPDRIVMLPCREIEWYGPDYPVDPDRTIWIELKRPGEKVKPHQAREHDRMRKMGQRVEVVDSFERVDEALR